MQRSPLLLCPHELQQIRQLSVRREAAGSPVMSLGQRIHVSDSDRLAGLRQIRLAREDTTSQYSADIQLPSHESSSAS